MRHFDGKGLKWDCIIAFFGFREYGIYKLRDWGFGDFQLDPAKPGQFDNIGIFLGTENLKKCSHLSHLAVLKGLQLSSVDMLSRVHLLPLVHLPTFSWALLMFLLQGGSFSLPPT